MGQGKTTALRLCQTAMEQATPDIRAYEVSLFTQNLWNGHVGRIQVAGSFGGFALIPACRGHLEMSLKLVSISKTALLSCLVGSVGFGLGSYS